MTAVWPQLVSSALVGTQRRPCRPEGVDGPLATVVPAGELDAPRLLDAAAAITIVRRASVRPTQVALPEAAPLESTAAAPARAGTRLGRLLEDLSGVNYRHRLALLTEWLELAQARGLLAPPRHVAALADLATDERELRPVVRAIGGARLAWLAGAVPDRWAWIGGVPTERPPSLEDWHTGRIEERAAYLRLLRASDPAAGRALLEKVWPQEKAADLVELIAACAQGLGPEDEPWLEKALDDRRVQVRSAVADLLAVLPGSAYRARAAARALACCRLDAKGRIEITLPVEFDAAMRRDGLGLKPPQGMGEKAWWLLQIVAVAPLDCWSTLDSDPIALLTRQARDDWMGLLRRGWARAAVAQRDAGWAAELTRLPSTQGAELAELLAVLPAEVLRERAIEMVNAGDGRMAEVLTATPAPWPPELTAGLVAHLREGTVGRQGYWWALTLAVERKLDPVALEQVLEMLPRSEGRLRDALERLTETLIARLEMHQEFA